MNAKPVYLDYNATTPLDPEVIAAMRPYLEEHFGNPSSSHCYGARPRRAVQEARGQVAGLLNCAPDEVIFTSGGTESNNHALKSVAAGAGKGGHIITSAIEHPAVTEVCGWLARRGFEITELPVDEHGLVSVADVGAALRPETVLVSIMHANNEVGTAQPIAEFAAVARPKGVLLHTDAAQSAGKIPVDVEALGVDLLSLAGHKLYAPKGIGALYARRGVALEKFMHGAGQERGLRAGTENVLEIVGLGKACEIARRDLVRHAAHMRDMRDALESGLRARVAGMRVNGHLDRRLPNTLSAGFRGADAQDLLHAIGDRVAASAGAACHSGGVEISHVLRAMHVPLEWARGTLRLSTGRMTTRNDIEQAIDAIAAACSRIAG
ncbi:MAG TPA: cysteine desulfurase family protein [Bryobacteraceae bacterium]|nr:cysteine desulfurase family protein [Bryobacteraceae bacterium]